MSDSACCHYENDRQKDRCNPFLTDLSADLSEWFCLCFVCLCQIVSFRGGCQTIFSHHFFLHLSAGGTRLEMFFYKLAAVFTDHIVHIKRK